MLCKDNDRLTLQNIVVIVLSKGISDKKTLLGSVADFLREMIDRVQNTMEELRKN